MYSNDGYCLLYQQFKIIQSVLLQFLQPVQHRPEYSQMETVRRYRHNVHIIVIAQLCSREACTPLRLPLPLPVLSSFSALDTTRVYCFDTSAGTPNDKKNRGPKIIETTKKDNLHGMHMHMHMMTR